jgi:DTW domain-containing protein YfiP
MHLRLCVCAVIEPLDLATRVVVVSHPREVGKPTNTGRLVGVSLLRGEVRVRHRGEALPLEDLTGPEQRPLLLFSGLGARTLTAEHAEDDGRERVLIVPDGTWRQARRMVVREPGLAALPRVCLPDGPPSRYRLRGHYDPRSLATFEAVARALGVLEGPQVQRALERLFDAMVERTLWTRGKLSGPPPGLGPEASAG